ncbi:MAG TPA: ATP-binding protein [Chitinophagaceae bacterium]
MPNCFYAFCFLFLFSPCAAQKHITINQLKANITASTNPSQKLNALFSLCDEWESYSQDTLKKYADEAQQIAISQKNKRSIILADYYQAIWLFQINNMDSAIVKATSVLNTYKKNFPYDEMYVKLYALRSNVLLRTAKMDELMSQNFEWMKLSEDHKDTLGIARANVGLGNVDLIIKKYEEALMYYKKALALMQNPVYKRKLSFIYNNIGIIFYHLAKEDSSLYYVKEGIRYSREDENNTNLANAMFLYGGMLAEFHHLKEAEENFKAAVEVRKKVGDVYYLITDMAQFALFYADNNEPDKGIALCKEALALVQKNTIDYSSLNTIYESLAKNYLVSKKYKDYSETLVKQMSLKDSLYKKNSAKALAEIQTKYELQKKENTIVKQKLDITQRNNLLYGISGFLIFAIIIAVVFFTGYNKRQKLKEELLLKEEKRQSEIAIKEAGEKERRRISADLHDNMGAYATAIIANVDDVITNKKAVNESAFANLKTNAGELMSNLRDTIWASNKENFLLTAISDRFKNYVQKINPAYPGITVEIEEEITNDILFSPVQALNIFRILQEAFTNAIKHSNANTINIFFKSDEELQVSISDNGTGITDTNYINNGNGIKNMRARARESDLNLSINENENAGTVICITSQKLLQT